MKEDVNLNFTKLFLTFTKMAIGWHFLYEGELKGELPVGNIGNHQISRLVLGSNLIGGWAHSRDLIYVPSLFKAYNTDKKVIETLILAEKS